MKYIITLLAALLPAVNFYGQNYSASYGPSHFANVALPPVPASLDFAGERVPLENFDTRESIQKELMVTCYMHSRTMQTMLNVRRYFPVIEPILEKHGIPSDFKYLCMAESGLNPNAVSSAKAAGLWQFMPATGKEYGLEVGSEVDERYHIEKSTEAACRYLLDSYRRFGSWTLVAAAYNLGNGGVSSRLKKQGVDNYYDAFFPQETLRYVFRILTFKLLTENPSGYGYDIRPADYFKPFNDYREVSTSEKNIDWSKFASQHGTTYKMLRELNPWIRDYEFKNASGKTYKVKIPGKGFRTE